MFIVKQQTIILLILAGLGPQLRNNLLIEELLFFRGIVAVGTQEGHIYLLDIALDDADDSKAAGYSLTFLESDETNPAESNEKKKGNWFKNIFKPKGKKESFKII